MKSGFRSIAFILVSLYVAIVLVPSSFAQDGRKVAVLYFTDHSKFDSNSGCGCLSLGPLNSIFGIGQKREKWVLSSGFRDLLNEDLKKSGYNVIESSYVDEVIRSSGKDNLIELANKLGADIMVIGDITKFEQHRTRISSQGPTSVNTGGDTGMKMNLMGGIGGFYYSSSIKTNVFIYDNSGNEIVNTEINTKKDLQDFFMGIGPLTKNYEGGEASKDDKKEKEDLIVDYKKLDKMKFGTEEFKEKTLFGLATMDAMDKIVAKVGEYIEPIKKSDVEGKVIYVGDGKHLKENEVYVDIGAGDGLVVGNILSVYIENTDLKEKKIGSVKVSKIQAEHLSIAEIIEGIGQVKKGNIVRPD